MDNTNHLNYAWEYFAERKMTPVEKALHEDGWCIETRYNMELEATKRIAKKQNKIVKVYYNNIPWFAVSLNGELL